MALEKTQQYALRGTLRYEWIFGDGFISSGGAEVMEELCQKLDWRPGLRVLDVGSGLGGAGLLLARNYNASVVGIDLTEKNVEMAQERLARTDLTQVSFIQGDIRTMSWANGAFDVIWTRDTLLHIPDKEQLFQQFFHWLAPGGQLLITDYGRGAKSSNREFEDYIESTAYALLELDHYGRILSRAGLVDVEVEDRTKHFVALLEKERLRLHDRRDDFLRQFSQEDFDYIDQRWSFKLRACRAGDLKWGWYFARHPA